MSAAQNSAHFKNEQRKQAATEERITRMREQARHLSPAELAGHTKCAPGPSHLLCLAPQDRLAALTTPW
jgi:hypothetical protein